MATSRAKLVLLSRLTGRQKPYHDDRGMVSSHRVEEGFGGMVPRGCVIVIENCCLQLRFLLSMKCTVLSKNYLYSARRCQMKAEFSL